MMDLLNPKDTLTVLKEMIAKIVFFYLHEKSKRIFGAWVYSTQGKEDRRGLVGGKW